MRPVLLRVYWVVRVLAYLVTLPATIVYLYAKGANPPLADRALCAIGDAYSNLQDYASALSYYKKAAALEDNPYVATYLFKAALVSEETGDMDGALKLYKEIEDKYPQTLEGYDIQKYISRIENSK